MDPVRSTLSNLAATPARLGLRRWPPVLIVGLIGPATGCAKAELDKLAPVAGKVWLDGKPLTHGGVSFRPDVNRGNTSQHIPTSTINAQGDYQLSTVDRKGAPPGWYKVLVFMEGPESGDENAPKGANPFIHHSPIQEKYRSLEKTDLRIEVVENPSPGAYDLRLVR